MMELPRVLTIAGSDSGGGAGIQADLKTFQAFDVFGMSAITSVTAQNTREVRGMEDISPRIVVSQIEAVVEDIGLDSVKIGMLSHAGIIKAVAEVLNKYELKPVVLDPVMISKSGHFLLKNGDERVLTEKLIPQVTLITPNLPEAALIVGRDASEINTPEAMETLLFQLADRIQPHILLKGGHLPGKEIIDLLYINGEVEVFQSRRIESKNTHGTGCTLSSAIAAGLAQGEELIYAVKEARDYVARAIAGAPDNIGEGHGPMYHNIKSRGLT